MKKILIVLLFLWIRGLGQTPLDEIVAAEKGFAQHSVDENTRAAFLANFDDETISFTKGKPVTGRKDWLEREANNAYLFWWPVWADVASSGDFGFTTGPAIWGGERTAPKPNGGMYYSSVWKKNNAGVWKVVIDLGSAVYDPYFENKKDFSTPTMKLKRARRTRDVAGEKAALMEYDKGYVNTLNQAQTSFDNKFLSGEARIHRLGRKPATNAIEINALEEKGKFAFEQLGGDIARSADMAVTWGKVRMLIVSNGNESIILYGYMRVWKKEQGQWRIILDVIGG